MTGDAREAGTSVAGAAQGAADALAGADAAQSAEEAASGIGASAAVSAGEDAACAASEATGGNAPESADAGKPEVAASGAPEGELSAADRELEENNALASVFDDVRAQSAKSAFSTPDRWVELGLVPAHLSADDFEMMVYEYLEDYRRDHKDEIEHERRERAAKRDAVRSATHAVGVPPKIPNRRIAQIERDDERAAEHETDNDASAVASSAAPDALSASQPRARSAATPDAANAHGDNGAPSDNAAPDAHDNAASPELGVAATPSPGEASPSDTGSDQNADAQDDPFANLNIPEGYKLTCIEGEYVLVPDEDARPVRKEIHCEHIVTLVGQHSYYLYDSDLMTKNYAHWLFLAAEDNPLATFVDCVREEGRVYPRPLSASDLANEPFRMDAANVEETWGKVRDSGDYPDIERCEASNGDVYFFSTIYLSRVLAESLAEYESVERRANV